MEVTEFPEHNSRKADERRLNIVMGACTPPSTARRLQLHTMEALASMIKVRC